MATCENPKPEAVDLIALRLTSSTPFQPVVLRATALLAAVAFMSGCAGLKSRSDIEQNPNAVASSGANGPVGLNGASPGADLSDSGADLLAIPLEVNNRVLMWIDYFQGRGRPHMERYLSRSTRYAPTMKRILKENGLPEDLIYIALIESGFSSTAHSHASAVGYWQFIRGTGKAYNLQIDSYVDERRDFVKSTQAAADYFKGLYNLFGAWYLAIASYNVGENRVKSLVMKNHTRDFWKLARENRLPEETINYVPKFLAARLIGKEPEKYGFTDIEYMPPLEWEEVEFNSSIDLHKLAAGMGLEYDDLRDLNPSYKRGVAFEKNGKLMLRVPTGTKTQAIAAGPAATAGSRTTYVAAADDDYGYYRVRRGDTISGIARKFNTTQHRIRALNRMSSQSHLVAGRRIRVPSESVGGLSQTASQKRSKGVRPASNEAETVDAAPAQKGMKVNSRHQRSRLTASAKGHRVHVVRQGDTLIQIARRYGVSITDLAEKNNIIRRSRVNVGARLVIP